MYRFRFREGWKDIQRRGCRADRSRFTESFCGKLCLIGNPMSACYDINRPGRLTAHHTRIQHPSSVSLPIPIKGVPLASPFLPIPWNAIPHLCLLLGPFYPRQPDSTYQQLLARVEFVQWHLPLSNYLEHYLELHCHDFLMYMGGGSSEYSVS